MAEVRCVVQWSYSYVLHQIKLFYALLFKIACGLALSSGCVCPAVVPCMCTVFPRCFCVCLCMYVYESRFQSLWKPGVCKQKIFKKLNLTGYKVRGYQVNVLSSCSGGGLEVQTEFKLSVAVWKWECCFHFELAQLIVILNCIIFGVFFLVWSFKVLIL